MSNAPYPRPNSDLVKTTDEPVTRSDVLAQTEARSHSASRHLLTSLNFFGNILTESKKSRNQEVVNVMDTIVLYAKCCRI
jgi:hypothetical protein